MCRVDCQGMDYMIMYQQKTAVSHVAEAQTLHTHVTIVGNITKVDQACSSIQEVAILKLTKLINKFIVKSLYATMHAAVFINLEPTLQRHTD